MCLKARCVSLKITKTREVLSLVLGVYPNPCHSMKPASCVGHPCSHYTRAHSRSERGYSHVHYLPTAGYEWDCNCLTGVSGVCNPTQPGFPQPQTSSLGFSLPLVRDSVASLLVLRQGCQPPKRQKAEPKMRKATGNQPIHEQILFFQQQACLPFRRCIGGLLCPRFCVHLGPANLELAALVC